MRSESYFIVYESLNFFPYFTERREAKNNQNKKILKALPKTTNENLACLSPQLKSITPKEARGSQMFTSTHWIKAYVR